MRRVRRANEDEMSNCRAFSSWIECALAHVARSLKAARAAQFVGREHGGSHEGRCRQALHVVLR